MSDVWVVDDDQSMRWVLERALSKDGLQVQTFSSANEALSQLQVSQPKVVLSDIRMPGLSGLEFLESLRKQWPDIPVIIMTAYSDLDSAVSAFQGGAFEYLAKPFDLSQATTLVRRAMAQNLQSDPVASNSASSVSAEIIGQAPAMQEMFRAIGRLSNSNATVMVTGESGSGKELVALALHRHGNRHDKPFVALNTAAIPRDLLESELFGHERGSFTGAQQMRRGRFEQAEGGTLFLDEIGDMPAELQTRLLRVLSDGNYYRVGGHQPIKANVRVIAATHQKLEERVSQGLFREDLFHRLNVIRIKIPALRERLADVPILAQHFLKQSANQLKIEPKRLTASALDVLAKFQWPGNVRQLENLCHWINIMAPGQVADVQDLPAEIRSHVGITLPAQQNLGSLATSLVMTSARQEEITLASDAGAGRDGGGGLDAAAYAGFASDRSSYASSGQSWGGSAAGLVRTDGPAFNENMPKDAHSLGYPLDGHPLDGHPPETITESDATTRLARQSAPWKQPLEQLAKVMLNAQPRDVNEIVQSDLMDQLTKQFEASLITVALQHTKGRRIEAAVRLGIGRNTITRKIQELKLDE